MSNEIGRKQNRFILWANKENRVNDKKATNKLEKKWANFLFFYRHNPTDLFLLNDFRLIDWQLFYRDFLSDSMAIVV